MSSVIVHAFGTDTDLGSIQRKIHILTGDWPTARPRIVAFHRQQAIHHTTDAIGLGLLAAFIKHGEKSPGSPFTVIDCIKTETGWRVLDQASRIDLRRIGAAGHPGVAAQVQLTRRVIAGVTGDATMIEDRAYLFPVIRRIRPGRGGTIKAPRIGGPETLVELAGNQHGGATGDQGKQAGQKKTHG
jgi:hypothetical protein